MSVEEMRLGGLGPARQELETQIASLPRDAERGPGQEGDRDAPREEPSPLLPVPRAREQERQPEEEEHQRERLAHEREHQGLVRDEHDEDEREDPRADAEEPIAPAHPPGEGPPDKDADQAEERGEP